MAMDSVMLLRAPHRSTNDQGSEGVVFFYKGAASGINTTTPTMLEGALGGAAFGLSVGRQ